MSHQGSAPTGGDLVEQVRLAAIAGPSAIAIETGRTMISYQQLLRSIAGSARLLRGEGLREGDTVILHAERTARLPVTLLALWEIGVKVALVDGALPAARLTLCERVVGARWRLGTSGLVPLPGGQGVGRVSEGASHVLLTSGTTGTPAAVEIGPGALLRTLAWYRATFAPAAGDRIPMLGGLGHDPVLRDVLGALTSGATLVVPDKGVFARPDRLPEFLRTSRTSVLHATPALLELVAAPGGRTVLRLPGLRLVVSAGAVLRAGTVRRLGQVSDAHVVNAYGTTETPQIASCERVAPGDLVDDTATADGMILPIGTGAGATTLMLAGRAERGEVIVRGRDLALGYVTGTGPDARFTADPLGMPGYRAYHTGDIGERDHRGRIRVVGRADRQLDLNGHRIAPEEIESAALGHPAVLQAVAGTVPTPTGELLSLSVVLRPGTAVEAAALRADLRTVLPDYAVPARVRVVPRHDLTANHKIAHEHTR
ncbi:MAG: AMP-binding protein [Actinobacteria bacterium]|nr:AMP-binding protein [Actinomycetota bacterium]